MRVCINNLIIFDEDTMSLSPMNKFLPTIKLGSIHTRCFSYLCLKKINNESIVSKKELFYEGWEKHGLVSSDNSLAQTIFQIRRALRPFNLSDTISTIPRVGFTLRRIKIEPLSPQAPFDWKSKEEKNFLSPAFLGLSFLPRDVKSTVEQNEGNKVAHMLYFVPFAILCISLARYS